MSKRELVRYVDQALRFGDTCFSKRGRKSKNPKDTQMTKMKILEMNAGNVKVDGSQKMANQTPINVYHSMTYNITPPRYMPVLYSQPVYQSYSHGVPLFPVIKGYEKDCSLSTPAEGKIFNTIPIPFVQSDEMYLFFRLK
jgi:hypothetical protein